MNLSKKAPTLFGHPLRPLPRACRSPLSRACSWACLCWACLCACLACSGSKPVAKEPSERADVLAQVTREKPTMDPKAIVFSLRGEEEAFRKCFMRSIGDQGRVTLRFDVAERGVVEDASIVESTLQNDQTAECVRARLLEHRFSDPGEPVAGKWTFVFRLAEPLDDKARKRLLWEAHRDQRPPVFLDKTSAGSMDTSKVDEIVQERYPLYAHCYRDSIARVGKAGGVLRLRFSVGPSGAVTEVEDAGSVLPDPFALDCMAEAFYAMVFPPPQGGPAQIHYRLDLQ